MLTLTVSEVKITCRVSFSNSFCASFDPGANLFLYHNSHINNSLCVLILRNLDVLLPVDLLDDPGRLHLLC